MGLRLCFGRGAASEVAVPIPRAAKIRRADLGRVPHLAPLLTVLRIRMELLTGKCLATVVFGACTILVEVFISGLGWRTLKHTDNISGCWNLGMHRLYGKKLGCKFICFASKDPKNLYPQYKLVCTSVPKP